jgi:hypothetical protein
MKHGMQAPHIISDMLTKFHIQLIHILATIAFLSCAMFEF